MDLPVLQAVLREYGLGRARLTVLDGGAINDVYRADHDTGVFVLKRYSGVAMDVERLDLMSRAESLARTHGVPVPETVRTGSGASFVQHDGTFYVLSRFVVGRTLPKGEVSVAAARAMGTMLSRLHDAFAVLPAGPAWELPYVRWIDEHLRALLAIGLQRRASDPVDELACRLLEHKLDVLSKLSAPPAFEPGWTHRDYTGRNLLFDDEDRIVAVIDFDAMRYTSRGYEVMRCLDHSFEAWSDEGFAFFEGYAREAKLKAADVEALVDLFCYVSAFSTWPMRARYLSDEPYQARWDEFITLPDRPWDADPAGLKDRLVAIINAVSIR